MMLAGPRFRPTLAFAGALAAACAAAQPLAQTATVGAREITALVEHAVLAQLRDSALARDARRIEAVAGALDSRLALAACSEPLAVTADLSRAQARLNARVSCAAPSPWSIYVPVEIRVYRPVLVAARDLARGERLGAADAVLEERNTLVAGAPPLTQPQDVAERAAKRPIPAGTVLSASLLELPVLVRRGDRLSVSSHAGGISVQVTAEALGTARGGERVRVRNLQSGKEFDAIVTGSATAEAI